MELKNLKGFSLHYLAFVFLLCLDSSLAFGATYYYKKMENGVFLYTNIPPVRKGFKRIVLSEEISRKLSKYSLGRFRYSNEFDSHIVNIASRYGLDPDLVKAIIKVESDFNPNAVSPKGAIGIMQLMPETAREQGVSKPFDPLDNIRGGVRYLKGLMDTFNGNLHLALAGYNAGKGAVIRYGYAIPPYAETIEYVEKVLTHYGYLKKRTNKDEMHIISSIDGDDVGKLGVNAELSHGVYNAGESLDSIPGFTVQVASFRERALAEDVVEELRAKGYPAFIKKTGLELEGVWYRVRIGRFKTKEEAMEYGRLLRKLEPSYSSLFVAYY